MSINPEIASPQPRTELAIMNSLLLIMVWLIATGESGLDLAKNINQTMAGLTMQGAGVAISIALLHHQLLASNIILIMGIIYLTVITAIWLGAAHQWWPRPSAIAGSFFLLLLHGLGLAIAPPGARTMVIILGLMMVWIWLVKAFGLWTSDEAMVMIVMFTLITNLAICQGQPQLMELLVDNNLITWFLSVIILVSSTSIYRKMRGLSFSQSQIFWLLLTLTLGGYTVGGMMA
jgi:hypothetical protein